MVAKEALSARYAVILITSLACSSPAFAYRPFDGTDAAVAPRGGA